MNISEAQYIKNIITEKNDSINAVFDGQLIFVPIDPNNRHYAEILKQVEEGKLTIKDAD
jgi:hypothetical protein